MKRFDAIIVGAGLSGVVLATRLAQQHPDKKFALLERQPSVGGRLRTTNVDDMRWGYGLGVVSEAIYRYLDLQLKSDVEGPDLHDLGIHKVSGYGVLAAGKISTSSYNEAAQPKGAKALAGASAAREWTAIDDLLAKESIKDAAFGNTWPLLRKAASALVLEHLTRAFGISELWSAPAPLVVEQLRHAREPQYAGSWENVLQRLLARVCDNVTFCGSSLVAQAKYDAAGLVKLWTLQTESGVYEAPLLAVAQSPWEALTWLPKEYWPAALIPVATKAKPVSLLVLSERFESGDLLPDLLLIPAEEVQVRVQNGTEICYQATLDYELTMQAPNVVKAVKRLRRAKAKLHASLPELKTSGEHLALVPVGWSQVASHQDRRYVDRLGQKSFQQSHLVFVGDAYGAEELGDANLLHSIDEACASLEF